ncbi:hypothetical protein [Nocardia sp. NRRL S-836]|uniref:hypothetical protein n=1 Tax=Nocardia sp. NRRL S-836 TaxID=1519492 RepID=UPI0006AFED98|nr:hypothetical protein [Nocardia sp. NRRL S-836]KOV83473.1 hypothetical protein ADL03_20595 [Nocardia sp. NRRL S-836]
MGRAGILDEQAHAADVLIELFEAGLPPTVWYITDTLGSVVGSPIAGISDHESYATMVHCAKILGMQLEIVPPRSYWQSQGSDEEHSPPAVLTTPHYENYIIKGNYRGVRLSCEGSARAGTAKKTNVPKFRKTRSPEPAVTAQLEALAALRGLLSADLPALSWRVRPEHDEPRLAPEISTYQRRGQARTELVQWADFLGTRVRYDPKSLYSVSFGLAEVTGSVDGVPLTITAYLRRPLSDTRLWQVLRQFS